MTKMISLLMIVLLLLGGAVMAQDIPTFCGDLAEADCTLLKDSQAAMMALDSSKADFEMNILVEGIPDMDAPLNFSITGSAAFTGGDSFRELSAGMTPETMSMEDMGALMGTLADALAVIGLDLQLQIALPPELVKDAKIPSDIALELKLVDGLGYLNLDTLKAFLGEMEVSGWYGLDVAGLLRLMGPQMGSMMGAMSGGMTMGMNPELMMMAQDPERMANYMSVARTDDGSSDMATFEFSIDLAAMYSDPAMADMLRQQMSAQMAASGQKMTDEQIDMAMNMVTTMFKDVDLKVIEMIGLTDNYIHSIQMTFGMDMAEMMASLGEKGAAPKISFDMTITEDQFNAIEPITAPEDATVIPLESIGQMFGGAIPNQQ